ncbi:GDP-mannose 4,6-dehydratase [bacterium]|nr:GDP-mannose 4,6-dehydratase [bacterium]RQV96345.1 MAG: NAD-dependent epimerase/dehydratase family protein [bacterium]
MHILVTGGAGFIGSHLCEKLIENKHRVIAVDNLSTGNYQNIEHLVKHKDFTFVFDTIENEAVLDRIISDVDYVFHLAAAVGVDLIVRDPVNVIRSNVLGTEVILKTANRYRKKTIIASTSEVYGKSEKIPFREDDDSILGPTTKNRWSYACSKLIDEFSALAYHHKYNLPVVIVRFFNTVGPRQTGRYGMVIPRMINQALMKKPLTVFGTGKQKRCFCHVSDTIGALIKLTQTEAAIGNIYNIGSTEEITIEDLAHKIKRLTHSNSELKYISYDEAYETGFEDIMRRIPSIDRIHQLIGFKPKINLDNTIQDMISYEKMKIAQQSE